MKATIERILVVVAVVLICAGGSLAAELHPIVEVKSGYLFGGSSDGKWAKAEETAKLISDETTYRVYGLTKALGEAKGGKPTEPEGVPCEEICGSLAVAKTRKRCDRNRCFLECITARTKSDRYNAKSLR